jgi:hypothetical protein
MNQVIPKRPRDPNQLAKSIIDIATGEKPAPESKKPERIFQNVVSVQPTIGRGPPPAEAPTARKIAERVLVAAKD